MSLRRWIIVLVAFLAVMAPLGKLTVMGSSIAAPPAAIAQLPIGAAAALAQGSDTSLSQRAMEVVNALADGIGTRPAGTEAERRAASFLSDEFAALGYAVEVVSFRYSSARFGSGTSQNVVATAQGEDPSLPLVVIGGHYDSVPAGPGANDNASGTGTTLAVARELMRSPVPGVAVRFIAFGAEEIGLFGSKDYVSKLSQADRSRLQVAISIDMMSVGQQPAFGGSEPWLSEAMVRAASQGYEPRNRSGFLRQMSDHAPFLDAGLPGIMFHWVEDPYYHTALDISANVQPAALELMGAIAIELVRVAAGLVPVNETTLAEAHVVVHGHVQGVYFRQSLKQEADLRGLCGWVRNLPDGSVEALVQGPRESVSALVTWARHGPSRARVKSAEVSWSGVETPLNSFKVTD